MLDSNILIGLWRGYALAEQAFKGAASDCTLAISPVVHTELFAHPNMPETRIAEFLADCGISEAPISPEVFTLAGQRFAAYAERRRQAQAGLPRRIGADFIIGAHALTIASVLVTLDGEFFRRNFAELRLWGVSPATQ